MRKRKSLDSIPHLRQSIVSPLEDSPIRDVRRPRYMELSHKVTLKKTPAKMLGMLLGTLWSNL